MSEFNYEEIMNSEIMQNPTLLIIIFAVAALILLLIGFNSYKIFRALVTLCGAAAAGYAGFMILGPMLFPDAENIVLPIVIAVVCAILGGLIAWGLYKFAIFVGGAYAGYLLSGLALSAIISAMPDVEFFQTEAGVIVVIAVCALLGGLITSLLFKHVFILSTSFAICSAACVLIFLAVLVGIGAFSTIIELLMAEVPDPELIMAAIPTWLMYGTPALSLILSICAIVNQYKSDAKNRD